MLRNCFLPVDYNQQASRTCGEIVYQDVDEFIITCTLCKIKIFVFDEFVSHLKNAHLEELVNGGASSVSTKTQTSTKTLNDPIEEDEDDDYDYHEIIKSEYEFIDNEPEDKIKYNDGTQDLDIGDDLQEAATDNDQLSNGDEEFISSEEADALVDDGEEQEKRILRMARKPNEHKCEICGKKYADERGLQMHVKLLHLREKPFKCTYCEQSFAEERFLQKHIGTKHTGYDCPTCHKKYSSCHNLKRHMLIHVEVKEFVCPEKNCVKAFASKGLLNSHQRYHRTQIFICEECGYKCHQRESLIVHKRHHTGEKPFACKQCGCRFISKPLLKEHMTTHKTKRKR